MMAAWGRQSAACYWLNSRSKWPKPLVVSDSEGRFPIRKTAPFFSTGRSSCRVAAWVTTASTRWRRRDRRTEERVDVSLAEAGPSCTTRITTIARSARSLTAMANTHNPARKHDAGAWFDPRRYLPRLVQWARSAVPRSRPLPFLDRCKPGIFVVASPAVVQELVAEARDQRLVVAWVDMERLATHKGFLAETGRVLNFPDYYGQNWDAFEECIRDLSWLPARGYLLVLAGYDRLARSDPENRAIGSEVLEEAVNTWSRTESPMVVLLQGSGDAAPGVPPLRCLPKTSPPKVTDRRILAEQPPDTRMNNPRRDTPGNAA